jgi:uracil phosphoribosyltransferase
VAHSYYCKLPQMQGCRVLLLDPMLATGGSATQACDILKSAGAEHISLVCVVAAPEGRKRLEEAHPDVDIYAAALDRALDERKFILPGLGDYGDRLYGTP